MRSPATGAPSANCLARMAAWIAALRACGAGYWLTSFPPAWRAAS